MKDDDSKTHFKVSLRKSGSIIKEDDSRSQCIFVLKPGSVIDDFEIMKNSIIRIYFYC